MPTEQLAATPFGTPEKLDEAGLVTPEGFVAAEQPTVTELVTLDVTPELLFAACELSLPLSFCTSDSASGPRIRSLASA